METADRRDSRARIYRYTILLTATVGTALLLNGCAAEPGPAPTQSASVSVSPETGSPSPTISGDLPSSVPTPPAEFTTRELADVCIVAVEESSHDGADSEARPRPEAARSAQSDDRMWSVAVPVAVTSTDGKTETDVAYLCRVRGSRYSFQVELQARSDYRVADDWQNVLKRVADGDR